MAIDFSQLLNQMAGKTQASPGVIQAQTPGAVPYSQPPASQLGAMSQQAYAMAGPAPQIQRPTPPSMGVPNRPGLPGGSPLIPKTGSSVPMLDPQQILQMIRGGGLGRLY